MRKFASMSHFSVSIPANSELQQILVALLAEQDYEGFEETETQLLAYIPESSFNEATLITLLEPFGTSYALERIEQTNWNAVWESNFEPVLVGAFCGIRAHFHPPFEPKPLHELIITPKMSFGTGHHATTYSMIELMRDVSFAGKQVFDFGTGTGILAILAQKLGAASVVGLEIDDWVVENARENVSINQAAGVEIELGSDLLGYDDQSFDILLANINRNVLLAHMKELKRLLKVDGILILSGILQEDESDICQAALSQQLYLKQKVSKASWLALSFDTIG
jgi:ribosomal protein L11 methyltransferase